MLKMIFILILTMPALAYGQWIQQGNDIDGEAEFDQSGWATSMNADGSIVAIGARYNDAGGSASGHARVFENQGGNWVQKGQDIDGVAVSDRFGFSISISADGDVLAVGAPDNNGNGFEAGHVRVFRFESDSWVQIGSEIVGEAGSDHSGHAVSLSADGTRLAIGAPDNGVVPNVGSNFGQVRIYENQSDDWVKIGEDIDGENPEDNSGFSVSINNDGTIVAIGAPVNGGTGISSGHVRVYRDVGGEWTQIGDDIDGGQEYYKSGSSVDLDNAGDILVIGATDTNNSGSARVYENQSDTWVQIGSDIVGEEIGDDLGYAVSINEEGNIIAVGAIFNDETLSDAGHVRVFKNQSNNWVQIGDDIDGEGLDDRSGTSVSLSADGSIVAIGAHLNDGNGSASGHVRVYENSSVLSIGDVRNQLSFSIYPNPSAGQFSVKAETQKRFVGYECIDMSGRSIEPVRKPELNIPGDSDLEINIDVPPGIYLLLLKLENGSVETHRIEVIF